MTSHHAGKRGLASLVKIVNEKGLVSDAVKVEENLSGGSRVPLDFAMSKWLNFKAWTSFDGLIEKTQKRLKEKLTSDKCLKGDSSGGSSSMSSSSPACDGTFRHAGCVHKSCRDMAKYKEDMHQLIGQHVLRRENDFYGPIYGMLRAVADLTHRIRPDLSYLVEHQGYLNILRSRQPDFVMHLKDGNKDHHKKVPKNNNKMDPAFAMELKHPRIKLNQLQEIRTHGERKPPENNAQNVAISYNERFRKAVAKRESGDKFEIDALHKALIQTNFYGLSLHKGLSVLWTHNEAVFFRAQPGVNSGKVTGIDVLTSKVYPCSPREDMESTIEALVALMVFAPDAHDMRDFHASATYLANKIKKEKEEEEKNKKKEESSSYNTQASGSSSSGQKDADKKKSQKKTKKRQVPFIDRFMSQLIMENLENLPNRFENMSHEEQGELLRGLRNDEFLCLNLVEMETMFVQHYEEMIAVGGSGKVLYAEIGGLPVVIKKWNMDSEGMFAEDGVEALEALRNEVKVHKTLVRQFPELLGEVVPRLYAVLEEPEDETTLVTEHVGDKLVRHCLKEESAENGRFEWYVDGELLTEKDEVQINEAATKAIWQLHERGIDHQDYRADNLRVKRIIDESGEPNWRVWWIDFGLAKIREGKRPKPIRWTL